jgi:hypothetical protein
VATVKRFALTIAVAGAALAVVAPSASAKFEFFQTPSGNIACVISGKGARCDIQQHSWPTPPNPPSCLDLDYGNGAEIAKHGPGTYVCAGDTVFAPANPVLGYGDKIKKKRFKCASKQKGVRCVNKRNDHGFFISREEVRLF